MSQLQPITFFVDRCLGNRTVVETLRNLGLTVEIHDKHFDKNAQDVDWVPEIGKKGWVVLTKDANIGKRTSEKMAVVRDKVKMFTLAKQDLTAKQMSDAFVKGIIRIQDLVRQHPGPFIAKIYRDGRVEMWKDEKILSKELKKYLEDFV